MEVQPDFRELLGLFNAHSVEYMIVGGYALAFHGAPRFTGDLDIFVRPTAQNARRILGALEDFGFGSLNLSAEEFSTQGRLVQLKRQSCGVICQLLQIVGVYFFSLDYLA